MARHQALSFTGVQSFLEEVFADDLHAKRILSLAGATAGVLQTGSLAVGLIGQGLALARGRLTKHATKQVDRLLSNRGVEVETLFEPWVRFVIGERENIVVAMDWTEFNADGQATIMLSLLGQHGHTTPLVWHTVETATLKDQRTAHEYRALVLRFYENWRICVMPLGGGRSFFLLAHQ